MTEQVTGEPAFVRWIPTEHQDPGLTPGWWHDLRTADRTVCDLIVQAWTHRGVFVDLRLGWRGGARWVPEAVVAVPPGDPWCSSCTARTVVPR